MGRKRTFEGAFGGKHEPEPRDVAAIGTQLSIALGTRLGLEQKVHSALMEQLAGPAALADSLAEKIGAAVEDGLGDAQLLAAGIVRKAQGRFMEQIITPTETAIRLGWAPAGAPGTGAGGKAKRPRKRSGRPDPRSEQPPSLSDQTGDPAGAPGADGPQAVRADESPLEQARAAAEAAADARADNEPPAPAGNGGGAPPSGGGAPVAGAPAFGGFSGPGYGGQVVGATVNWVPAVGPGGAPGVMPFPNQPANLAGGVPVALDGLGRPVDAGGRLVPQLPPDAAAGQPGGPNVPLWFLPFPAPGVSLVPPYGSAGGAGRVPVLPNPARPGVFPPLERNPGGVVPVLPGGVGDGTGGDFGPPPPPPPGGGGAGGDFGGGGSVGNGSGGGGGGAAGGGAGGQGGGGGPGGAGGSGGQFVINVQPTPVNLSCPAPVVQLPPITLQCPSCGQVGQAPPITILPGGASEAGAAGGTATAGVGAQLPPLINIATQLAIGQLPGAPAPAGGGGGGGSASASASAGGAPPGGPGVADDPRQPPDGAAAQEALGACLPGSPTIREVAGKTILQLLRAVGYTDAENNPKWIQDAFAHLEANKGWFGDLGRATVNVGGFAQYWIVRGIEWLQSNAGKISGCEGPDVGTAWIVQCGLSLLRRVFPHLPDSLTYDWDIYCQWACPIEIPSQAEANRCYLTGTISTDDWRCLTRANGNAEKWQRRVVQSEIEWPTIDQLIGLERRGKVSPELAGKIWERNAVPPGGDEQRVHRQAAEWVPSPSDVIEWMGKDIGDPLLVQTFGLANEFRQKFRGHISEAARWNGINEEDARHIFMAHRRSAAAHQMYEMHKRLRPGWWGNMPGADALHMAQAIAPRRPQGEGGLLEQASSLEFLAQQREVNALYGGDAAALARFGGKLWAKPVVSPDPGIKVPANLTGLPPQWLDEIGESEEAARAYLAETVTSGFHVFEGLSQQNYPPFWRARLLAMSYNVLTRVDMRRAYETGQITKPQLVEKYQDRGYTPVDSALQANFNEAAAVQLVSRRPAVGQWVKTGYDINLLRQALIDQGMRPELWPAVKAIAETRRKIDVQQRCIGHLKKQVIANLVEPQAVAPRLVAIGVSGPEAARLQQEWACEVRSIPKAESAAQVCKYLHQALIGPEQAVRLIHRAGYTYPQSRKIVNSCLLSPAPKGIKRRPALDEALRLAREAAPAEEQEELPAPPDEEGGGEE